MEKVDKDAKVSNTTITKAVEIGTAIQEDNSITKQAGMEKKWKFIPYAYHILQMWLNRPPRKPTHHSPAGRHSK